MQSNQFSGTSEGSQIRGTREKERPQQTTDWGRILYLTFLGAVVLVLIYYAISSFVTLDAGGRVITGNLTLRAPNNIKIHNLYIRENSEVSKGDSLFSYRRVKWHQNLDSLQSIHQTRRDLRLKIRDLERQISLKKQRLQALQTQLNHLQQRRSLIIQEIKLNVQSPSRIHDIEQQLVELQTQINIRKQELKNLEQNRTQLQNDLRRLPQLTTYGQYNINKKRVFRSPIGGEVSMVYTNDDNMLMSAERILSIERDTSKIFIRASFSQGSVQYLERGEILDVRFSNGVVSKGVITDYYMAYTNYLRNNRWIGGIQPSHNVFTPNDAYFSTAKVIVELSPINRQIEDVWRANEHISCRVYLKKITAWPTTFL